MKAVFKTAYPYLADEMNLPVGNLDAAIPFYETVFINKVSNREALFLQTSKVVVFRSGAGGT